MLAKSVFKCVAVAAILAAALAACDRGGSGTNGDNADDAKGSRASGERGNAAVDGAEMDTLVDAETLAYAEVDEKLVYGYFAFPSNMIEPLPAIIAIHDWWGVNDDMQAAANRLASDGYMVLAVDLYNGDVVDHASQARARMISVLENPEFVEDNIRQALDFVNLAGAPSVATLGWGFGGGWSLNSAMLFPNQVDAAVIYYGQVTNDEDKLRGLQAPVLGLFGARDRRVSPESVNSFDAAMKRIRYPHEVHIYPDIGHAFADPARSSYDESIAADAWQRAADFLAANLALADES